MTRTKPNDADTGRHEHSPRRVHIPRFVSDEDAGLGDVLTRMTRSVGIRPCGGCERRAATLNRWFPFHRGTG
jgi:hypothetical protein